MRYHIALVLICLLHAGAGSAKEPFSYRILGSMTDHAPGAPPHYFVSVDSKLAGENELLGFICFFAQKENLTAGRPFDINVFYQLDSLVPGLDYSEEAMSKYLCMYLWRPGTGGRLVVHELQPDGSRRGKNTKADHTKHCKTGADLQGRK